MATSVLKLVLVIVDRNLRLLRIMNSKQRSFNLLWLLVLVPLALFGVFLYQLLGPPTPVVVSPETTRITAPLAPDGLPDYIRHIHQRAMADLNPEDNAAPLYWTALWPGELSPEQYGPICDALGIEDFPDPERSLEEMHDPKVRADLVTWLTGQLPEAESTEGSAGDIAETLGDADGEGESTALDQDSTSDYDDVEYQAEHELHKQLVPGLEHWGVQIGGRIDVEEVANDISSAAMNRPWTSEQIPRLGQWAIDNKEALDLIVTGTNRARYYSPSPSALNPNGNSMIMMLLPGAQGLRSAARGLVGRAMLHIGEDRSEEAWRDIRACFRLARHACEGDVAVQRLVGIAIDSMAQEAARTMFHHSDLSVDQAELFFADLRQLAPLPSMASALDRGERLMYLDTVLALSRGMPVQNILGTGDGPASVAFGVAGTLKVDWNELLRDGNRWYDRLVSAGKIEDRTERVKALEEIDEEIQEVTVRTAEGRSLISGLVSSAGRTNLISDILLGLLLPAATPMFTAQDRAEAAHGLTRAAAALAVYRSKHGRYPDSLSDLQPDVDSDLFRDVYSDGPLIYRKMPDGFLLYSVFENGADDGGTDFVKPITKGEWTAEGRTGFRREESDMVIRMPRIQRVSD